MTINSISDVAVEKKKMLTFAWFSKFFVLFKNDSIVYGILSGMCFYYGASMRNYIQGDIIPTIQKITDNQEQKNAELISIRDKYKELNRYFHIFEASDMSWLNNACTLFEQSTGWKCPNIRDKQPVQIPLPKKKGEGQ